MLSYSDVISSYVDEFVNDPDEVGRVVVDAAKRYEDDYYKIVDVAPDDFGKVELEDFYEEVREAIRDALRAYDLI